MNGCEIIPTGSKSEFSDNDAVIPTVSRVLGCGAYGVVFLTGGKARARAIKFQPYGENSAAREIKMCHAFNKVAVEGATRVFTKTFGWYAVPDVPVTWYFAIRDAQVSKHLNKLIEESDNKTFICSMMEHHPYTFKELKLDMFHLKAAWFLLIHAFVVLRQHHKRGAHRDIHDGNIMFAEATATTVAVGSAYKLLQPLEYEPRLIDFQRAILTSSAESPNSFKNERTTEFKDGNNTFMPSDDMYRLAHCMQEKAQSQGMCGKKLKKFAKYVKTNVTQRKMYGYGHKHMEELLEHSFFDDIRVKIIPLEEKQQNKRLKV